VAAAQAPAAAPSVKAEFLRNYNDAADKAMRLADVVPADKYTWKPTPEVRGFSAVFMHIAAANFNFGRRVGGTLPEGVQLGPGFDTSATDKDKVQATLKQSVEFVRATVGAMSDADFEKTFQTPSGASRSYRDVLFALASHTHEHLGQAIAYTRMAGMVPPWTEEQQQRQQQAPKKNP
jgi:uncharacterized damage-inducible protein DinB